MSNSINWLLKEKYGGEKSTGFFADCTRLEAGEPLAYVIGNIPFLDTTISLSSHPLIPRPETEYWVGKAVEALAQRNAEEGRNVVTLDRAEALMGVPFRILDLCAGSGAIGVSFMKALPMTRVDFAEIDTRHHGTIVDNVCDNGLDYTLARVFGGDLFSEIPRGTRYDAILSNPPYIDPALDRAEPSVKKYEPANALYGGKDGMELITRIINDAHAYLSQNGTLWVEHEPEQAVRIAELGASAGFTVNTQNDQFGISRFSILSL